MKYVACLALTVTIGVLLTPVIALLLVVRFLVAAHQSAAEYARL